MALPIGVLALQGDFREHAAALSRIGVDSLTVRTERELDSVSGLIIPGGESTVIHKLSVAYGLFEPIQKKIRAGLPMFGTCAGLIMLSDSIIDGIPGQESYGGLDIEVQRNAFGNQSESFEIDLEFLEVAGEPVHAAFIRAPIISKVGSKAQILARLPAEAPIHPGGVVGVQQENLMGISFHPEVTGEDRIHALFAKLARG